MATIVVGTDGSDNSAAAVSEALDLAKRLDAKVVFVAVSPPVSELLGDPNYKDRVSENLNRARQALEAVKAAAESAGVEAEYELIEGDPAEEIANFAELRDADLVVVGTRGLGAIAGSLLGSVSSAVVRRSSRPVVVVGSPHDRA
jgi:nucleotide-binding universal stress UspA family protein